MPKDYFLVSILIPGSASILELNNRNMPKDWRSIPHGNATQQIGDRFVADSGYLVLQVPSAIVPGDVNFLVNPRHPDAGMLSIKSIEPFEFDSRFVSRKG